MCEIAAMVTTEEWRFALIPVFFGFRPEKQNHGELAESGLPEKLLLDPIASNYKSACVLKNLPVGHRANVERFRAFVLAPIY